MHIHMYVLARSSVMPHTLRLHRCACTYTCRHTMIWDHGGSLTCYATGFNTAGLAGIILSIIMLLVQGTWHSAANHALAGVFHICFSPDKKFGYFAAPLSLSLSLCMCVCACMCVCVRVRVRVCVSLSIYLYCTFSYTSLWTTFSRHTPLQPLFLPGIYVTYARRVATWRMEWLAYVLMLLLTGGAATATGVECAHPFEASPHAVCCSLSFRKGRCTHQGGQMCAVP